MSLSSKRSQHQNIEQYLNYSENDRINLEFEQFLEAGRQIRLAIFGNLFIGFLTIFIMWQGLPKTILTGWITLLIISILIRVVIFLNYQKVRQDTLKRWKIYFITASLFSSIIWGIGAIFIQIYSDANYHGIEAFILGGMASGAIVINTPIRLNYPAFMIPMLSLLTLYYLYLNDTPHLLMAAMVVAFMLILWSASVNFRNLQFEKHTMLQVTTDALNELQESEQRLKDITTSMGEGVFVINKTGALTFINPEGERMLGWTFNELTEGDEDIYSKIHKEENIPEKSLIQRSAKDDKILHSDKEEFKRKDGKSFPVSITAAPIHSKDKSKEGVVVVFQDITVQKELESKLEKLALHDALTGLYNRGSFNEALNDELFRAHYYDRNISLLIIDIDFFKKVNDTYGHQAGDKILKSIANIILSSIRKSDYAARYGGEEFVIILPDANTEKAIGLAENIRVSVEQKKFKISKNEAITLTISIGVGSSSIEISPKLLIETADKALYKAKENGRNQVQYL